jgi:hypothetical protein
MLKPGTFEPCVARKQYRSISDSLTLDMGKLHAETLPKLQTFTKLLA